MRVTLVAEWIRYNAQMQSHPWIPDMIRLRRALDMLIGIGPYDWISYALGSGLEGERLYVRLGDLVEHERLELGSIPATLMPRGAVWTLKLEHERESSACFSCHAHGKWEHNG